MSWVKLNKRRVDRQTHLGVCRTYSHKSLIFIAFIKTGLKTGAEPGRSG